MPDHAQTPAPSREPIGPRRSTRLFDAAAVVIVAYFALYVGWFFFRWGGPDLELAINDAAFIPLGIAAVGFSLAARERTPAGPSRRAWLFLALAFGAYCLGDVTWFTIEILRAEEVPYPSLADALYLAYYPLLLLGLVSLAREERSVNARFGLDLAIVLVGAGTVVWVGVLAPLAASLGSDLAEIGLAVAYPAGDMIVLFAIAAALLWRLTNTSRLAILLLGVGVGANIVADLFYARLSLLEEYESATWLDLAYVFGWTVSVLAGWAQARRPAAAIEHRAASPAPALASLPYATVALLYAVLIFVTLDGGAAARGVVFGAVLVTCLVLVRQILISRENARLQALEASLRVEAHYRAIIQNASDVIVVTDAGGTVTYVTPSCSRVLGRRPEDLVGGPIWGILDEAGAPAAAAFLHAAAARAGMSGTVEWRIASEDLAGTFDVTVTNLVDDPAIAGLVVTLRDITERKAFESQLAHQAFHDPLTGLANRALLANRVEHALSRARRRTTRPALVYFDLDDFKRINDGRGHAMGDAVLVEVASRIRGAIREGDTAARLGGDEFAVLIDETLAIDDAELVARRIIEELGRPIMLEGGVAVVGASGGIARSESQDDTMDELLRDADIAMYEAKRAARGSYRIFEPAMASAAIERAGLDEDLRTALENGELSLVFQPLADLRSQEVIGVETLLRWNHPRRGLVMPMLFIPIAEKNGTILPIGRWVLEEACRTVGAWNRERPRPLRLNVNVSVRQLVPGFVEDVGAILARTGFTPELLVLELTESIVAENRPEVHGILAGLRELGARISIDDFGTGYSSLSYLNDLPIDELKIDRSFVRALAERGDTSLVSAIIGLARKLGVHTVAEGIEQTDQASTLVDLGCDYGQGYLIGRPAIHPDLSDRQLDGLGVALGLDGPAALEKTA
jgi:diguanylate cyclase (GGDEF)-like protein/PAS domain S-box-containing protein